MLVENIMDWLPADPFLTFSACQQDVFHFPNGTPFVSHKSSKEQALLSLLLQQQYKLWGTSPWYNPGYATKAPWEFISNLTPTKVIPLKKCSSFFFMIARSRNPPFFFFFLSLLLGCPGTNLKLFRRWPLCLTHLHLLFSLILIFYLYFTILLLLLFASSNKGREEMNTFHFEPCCSLMQTPKDIWHGLPVILWM